VRKANLINGSSKSCGHNKNHYGNLLGQQFGEWTVIGRENYLWKCQCSCGKISLIGSTDLCSGRTRSCGHSYNKFVDITNKRFGNWVTLEYLGNQRYKCQCDCGKIGTVKKADLLRGASTSCGCNKSTKIRNTLYERYGEVAPNKVSDSRSLEQIQAIQSKENLEVFIDSLETKPTSMELSRLLGLHLHSTLVLIRQFELEDKLKKSTSESQKEIDLYNYVTSIYDGNVIHGDRNVLSGKELDIYIPDKKLAIEFNGNYWHSTIYKNETYHQEKTIECKKKGIRLIHIFEYEWDNAETQEKIKHIIKNALNNSNNVIYARDTKVLEVNTTIAKAFEDKYHLQGGTNSSINIALTYNDEIVALLAMGAPRFNSNFEYEIIRMCYKQDCIVVGGLEKLFSHFIKNYNPSSIITYCDLSKFIGDSYIRLGFKTFDDVVTKPNYVWWQPEKNKILPRYQTQKSKLVELGLGTEQQTENEIMESLNYIKIYDSGNLKLHWTK